MTGAGLVLAARSPFPALPFDEAIAWLRKRVPMTDARFRKLAAAHRERAFSVAAVSQLSLVAEVYRAARAALETGAPFDAFKQAVGDKLRAAWAGTVAAPGARVELVFRNAMQTAYSAGREAQMNDPAVAKLRPFREFVAVEDARTSKLCAAANGTVLPADHPWWATHTPPCHHGCRSTVVSLRASQAKAKGITAAPTPLASGAGFGKPPAPDDAVTPPDTTPPALRAAFNRKRAAGPRGES